MSEQRRRRKQSTANTVREPPSAGYAVFSVEQVRRGLPLKALDAAASDRLARVQRILDLATHVLGERDKAARWLTSKSRALQGDVPLQMLDTDLGAQRVQQELREIEFGMPL